MSSSRKRPRESGVGDLHITVEAQQADGIPPTACARHLSLLLQQRQQQRLRLAAAPLSFSYAPVTVLSPWQRVTLSSFQRLHGSEQDERHAVGLRRALQRDLGRYMEDTKRREERIRAEQREARARLGARLSTAVGKLWSRRGDIFQQLLAVEFDEVKQRRAEQRQEDLLREAENLTRTLLESIFSDVKCNDKDDGGRGGNISENVVALLEGGDETNISCGAQLETSLSLLDTQGGSRQLRDYQRSALRWMTNLYSRGLNGILADEMGLGKTIQTIALLAYYAEYKNDWGPHLIVVPTTVVLNWKAEFQRWCPGLQVIVYMGSKKERHRVRQGWMQEDAFNICITSYNQVVKDRVVFRRRPWGFLVLDEAHQVKNFMSKKWQSLFDLQVEYRLLLTGTPLQNSIMELWSLFHLLLPSASAFSSDQEFREWFSNPMEEMVTGRAALNEGIVRRLQALLRPFMLRRLKKDVEAQLPSKTEKVVMCRLSRRQRMLYDDYMQLAETRERISGGARGVLGVLLALRKVCNHPDMFEERRTVTPMALDHQSEIVIEVPRDVLLRGNNYSGCYRFQKWRLCIDDVSLPSQRGEPHDVARVEDGTLFDDSWLHCTKLYVLTVDHWWRMQEQEISRYIARYSTDNFHWPSDVPRIPPGNEGLSEDIMSVIQNYVEEEMMTTDQRRRMTTTIQVERYHRMSASVCVGYPNCLHIALPFQEQEDVRWGEGKCCALSHLPRGLRPTLRQRVNAVLPIAFKVAVYVPAAVAARPPRLHCRLPVAHYQSFRAHCRRSLAPLLAIALPPPASQFSRKTSNRANLFDASPFLYELWPLYVRRCFSFPDRHLLIHDCGKLQFLKHCLKQLRREGHRMLIFTQFVHMLNILERFLALIGLPYLRIDGSTQPERRQAYVDWFNEDERITCMILSTRSGGIGLNLTGADTVIFYDSDWNPTMDLQAQDRCHRIGQTKPVTIYRLISEHTVEESILQKARERKKLNNVVIRGGQFHAMANVDDVYEDTSAALAALSNPVQLRSFFHDLDEDATVVADDPLPGNGHQDNGGRCDIKEGSGTENNEAVDIRVEMMRLEDQEDREAQQNVEEELRKLEEQKRNDEEELGDEDKDEEDEDEDGHPQQRRGEGREEGEMMADPMVAVSLMSGRGSPAVLQKRRDILRRQRTPLDQLLSLQYAVCHNVEARRRYAGLCESYARQVGEDELPLFTETFNS
ncbi:SNF2 DNA repair protein, putative [Trypanosoma brucei brucei TREU927]|uniref:SNF2 DNA repair protein, putative n=1 Tax=Trypanosoma brucei brucei (strain 927/4 GUTat10.1) TaxID=185431 RepID=Q383K6_TRYB2|nr:SNF2 DNA repair protein, putative [Trypanosoma brucei brucei TREU927]EAN80025.1 SNF2 DNA repair protein, putative [Trypanosoma brucei brucei TREU927]